MYNKKVFFIILIVLIITIAPKSAAQDIPGYEPPYREERGIGGGSGGQPLRDLHVNISTNDNVYYRGDTLLINFSVKAANEDVKNIKINFLIPIFFESLEPISKSSDYTKNGNNIIFENKSMSKHSFSNCTYKATISISSDSKVFDLNKTINSWNWDRKRTLIINDNKKSEINIINNPPSVVYAEMQPVSSSEDFIFNSEAKYLTYMRSKNSNLIEFYVKIDAFDRDDNDLTYFLRINNSNVTNSIITLNISDTIFLWDNFRPGNYSFHVSVKDPLLESSDEILANISYNKQHYVSLIVPPQNQMTPLWLYAFIIATIIVLARLKRYIINIGRRSELRRKFIINYHLFFRTKFSDVIIIFFIISIITYIYFFIYTTNGLDSKLDKMLYSKSLSFFELYVYMVVFLIVVYITETTFGHHDLLKSDSYISSKPNLLPTWFLWPKPISVMYTTIFKAVYSTTTTSTLWLGNSLLMLLMLLSLDFLVYRISPDFTESWLRNYYGVMAEVFATILAIVAAFYVTIPKNIIITKEQLLFSCKDVKDPIGLAVIFNNAKDPKKDPLSYYIRCQLDPSTIKNFTYKSKTQRNLVNELNKIIHDKNLLSKIESVDKLNSLKSEASYIYKNRKLLETAYPNCLIRDIIEYKHPKMLNNFIILYSIIVLLSIWGLSIGFTAQFNPFVIISPDSIFNLIKIAIFEITLLLVPPAIILLYELLRSILFTGNIELDSNPDYAKIIIDGNDTGLRTPNKLMLLDGRHTILLKKEGYDYDLGCIRVISGTEQKYYCNLNKQNH